MITTVKFAKVRPTAEIPTKRVPQRELKMQDMISMPILKKII